MSSLPLQNRTALVTGASRGVGKGIALELARAGCNVAVNFYADPAGGAQTVTELRALGVDAFEIEADVGNSKDVQEMFDRVLVRFPRLDILVNNAGIQTSAPLLDVSESDWDRVINTNLKGCFLCTQAAGRHMKENSGGAIVNIGSGCNKIPFPRLVAYTASKGGIEMFTKVAALELGPYAIRVNCVAPGAILVERTLNDDPDYAKNWGGVTPLGRAGTPADVGRAVAFLASDEASYISGQTIWVDGGTFTKPNSPYKEE
jgi:NAD(P)-dependent dehydrogenase (short-subunit alcohol dehydrogenase family)